MADKKDDLGPLAIIGAIGGLIGLILFGKKSEDSGNGHTGGCGCSGH